MKDHVYLLRASGIIIALLLWEIAGRSLGETLLSPPSKVLPALVSAVGQGNILRELLLSLRQLAIGYGMACLIGMPLGIIMGRRALVDALFHPWVGMILVTSLAALVPIFMLVLGTGLALRTAIVFVGSIGYIILTAYHGAKGVDPRFVMAARSFSINGIQLYVKVLMPALFPYLITGARLGLVHGIRAMVTAEMFIVVGFGGLIYQSGMSLDTTSLMVYLVLLMSFSIMSGSLIEFVGKRLAPWYAFKHG